MAIYQELINFNEVFSKLSQPPIILNDIKNDSQEVRETVRSMILSRFSTDMVSLVPSCLCGRKKGTHTFFTAEEQYCDYCHTPVKSSIEDDIEPNVWVRKPENSPPIMNPLIWIMLKDRFSKAKFNIIQWLCDTSYRSKSTQPKITSKLVQAGIQRGYEYFYKNFDMIMEYLFSLRDFKITKHDKTDYLKILIQEKRDHIFSDYIPFPNKALLIMEKTNMGIYVDRIIMDAINAIEMLVSIDVDFYDQNPKVKMNRMIKALDLLCTYHVAYFRNNLSVKTGMLRRHAFGTRSNFACRAVITSITVPHHREEIWLPWGIGLTLFRPHLVNKLTRLGMVQNSIIGYLHGHINKYDPLLDKLLKELIAECRNGIGPCACLQRN